MQGQIEYRSPVGNLVGYHESPAHPSSLSPLAHDGGPVGPADLPGETAADPTVARGLVLDGVDLVGAGRHWAHVGYLETTILGKTNNLVLAC